MALRNAFENLSTEAKQNVANVLLTAIRDQVKDGSTDTVLSLLRDIATNDPITGTVALDTPTLMALEQTTVTVSNPTANPETGLAKEVTVGQRYAGGKLVATAQVTMAGNNTIITPSEGKSIRVFWVSAINNPDQASTPRMIFKFGTTEIYRAYALAHWEIFTGATNQPLVLELSSGGDVAVTVHYQEI